jgi:predicted ATPase/class 3 adenylate cyclase
VDRGGRGPDNPAVSGISEAPTGTVTFVFTDIEGSTKLLRQLGDGYRDLLEEHRRLLRETFRAGHVAGTEGDAFFVVFGSAVEAARAAVDGQRALHAHAWPDGTTVKVRMGLHTGEGVHGQGGYVGLDVHRGARIGAAAHGGQIIVSGTTRALIEGSLDQGVRLRDLGEHHLKDLPDPERLYELSIDGLSHESPPPRSLDARPAMLPADLTPFIGRAELLAEVEARCRAHRLVTLTGPGGTGKTRLAIRAAASLGDELADGVAFVHLASIAVADLVPAAIATALGVAEEPDRPVLETLQEHLRDRAMLLVLDNVEQVIDAAPVVPALLAGAPRVRVLATSREALRVDGEQEFPVPPMTTPDPDDPADPEGLTAYESVALFVARAQGVRPSFALDRSNAAAVARICALLDGLPLAIELAAARVRLLEPARILERLDDALPILAGGGRDRAPRQQTLRGAIAWSYDLLDEAERACFRRMAVFNGGFTFEAAEAVCDPHGELGGDALDLLGSLVDKSLLRRLDDHHESRFQPLFVIHRFAEELLEGTDEEPAIRARHAGVFLGLAEEAAPKLFGAEQSIWLDRLEEEHDNLRGALAWAIGSAETSIALRLASRLWRFWQMRGHLREGRERLDEVLAMPGVGEHLEAHAEALEAAGGIAYWMGEWARAADLYDRCLALRRSIGEPLAIAEAAYNRACIAAFATDEPQRSVEGADRLLAEALALFREADDRLGVAKVLWATGGNLVGHAPEAAIAPFHESLGLYRELGDRFGEAWALNSLGLAEAASRQVDEAEAHMREALELFLAADDRSAISLLLTDFAVVATLRGDLPRALRLAGASEAHETRLGIGLGLTATEVGGVLDRMWHTLPPEETERYVAEGRVMSVDDAIAYATKGGG